MADDAFRVGVYTCQCGGNISDVVSCDRLAELLAKQPGVAVSRVFEAMCSDAGQAMIRKDIQELGVNRVLVGACAPSLHEKTFRGAVARAGLNPFLYYHVGLREQLSWVHGSDPEGANRKALRMMNAGIAKVRGLSPLSPIVLEAARHALVIGGGVSGLLAARQISRRGLKVTLLEKSPFLGGRMAQLEETFPHETPARDELHSLIEEVLSDPGIEVHTLAEVEGLKGYIGDFTATVRRFPRGVADGAGPLSEAMQACPVTVPDEYNYGLTTRKALHLRYEGCFPRVPAIDRESCTKCGACRKVPGGEAIRLDEPPGTFEVKVGAIVVASGFKPYEPREGEYGYRQLPGVMTLPEFIRFLALNRGEGELAFDGSTVRSIGFVHCVGSRHIDGIHEPLADEKVNDYCSRVCCTATLHTAKEVRERYPDIDVFDFHEDIRAYGRGHEDLYTDVSKKGLFFLRFHGDQLPEAAPDTGGSGRIRVKTVDHLTDGLEVETQVDLLVLAVGFMPAPGVVDWDIEEEGHKDLARLLKISPGADRFLQEVHPKLRPVETAVSGIILAGTSQGPMNIQESCAAASAAASKVSVLLSSGHVELEPFVAAVDPSKCEGTGACVGVCRYEDAIEMRTVDGKKRAVVTPANCSGCGNCVSACPNGAIDVQGFTIAQYNAMIDALVADLPPSEAGT